MRIGYITDTYKEENEDSYGFTQCSFWVSDGASSLSKNNFTPNNNDVTYIVKWWNNYLSNHLDNLNKTISEILEAGIEMLNEEFSQFSSIESLSKLDRVSLGIAITRINNTVLECYVLGDVEISLLMADKSIKTITDYSIQTLDQQVIALMSNNPNRENELVFKGFTKAELDLLQYNRMKMNTNEGYYILEHESGAIKHGIYHEYILKNVTGFLLMTDGFAMLNKEYSKPALFRELAKRGVKSLLLELREIEEQDINMRSHQRLKAHDDATILYIEL